MVGRTPASSVRRAARSKTVWGALSVVALFTLSACVTTPDHAVGERRLREIGNSDQAVRARERTEKRLRDVARTYADRTPLSPGLVVLHDICVSGSGPAWYFQQETTDDKVACSMSVTVYYGADPGHMGETLAGIPLAHDDYGRRVLAYYRGEGPNPDGPKAPEPTRLGRQDRTLTWDTVRDTRPRKLIEEPYAGLVDSPPVSRVVRTPKGTTVAALRRRYGMVFSLELASGTYYELLKNGRTRTP